ncbi:MAG: hypothetical protein HY074_09720 [Deltaproteobacteria bacterium]|nr:hypothetical protein [Deltaproteobacteria bacterium]
MERVVARIESIFTKLLVATLVAIAIFLSFPKAFADKFNTETSEDARSLGMGNASINSGRGPYSVFYNPANIAARETGTHFQPLNLQFELSEGSLGQASGGNSLNFQSLSSLYSGLKNSPNTFAGGRYSLYPNVTLRNFSFGMLYEVNQGAILRSYDGALRVLARDRFSPTVALSERFASGIFRLGASVQLVTIGKADAVVPPPVPTAVAFAPNVNSMSALVFTGGTTITIPVRFLPSFSLVGRNLGNAKYSSAPVLVKFGDGRTAFTDPMMFDWGSSMTFILARRLEMKLSLDYHDLTNKLDGGRFRHVFTGTELIAYDILKLRAGLAHGYPSFGVGINTRRASLDFTAYADEMDDRLRGAKEQRYVFQYTWELFN